MIINDTNDKHLCFLYDFDHYQSIAIRKQSTQQDIK